MEASVDKIMCFPNCNGGDNMNPAFAMMAMNGGMNNWMNNPFIYLVWMMFANRMWGNNDNNAVETAQLQAIQNQMSDNQNTNCIMDAIKGGAAEVGRLADRLNCDFNTLNSAICDVRSAIQQVGGAVGFSAERVINAVQMGDANIISALQNCCCNIRESISAFKGDVQLQMCQQTNTLTNAINFVNSSVERGFSAVAFQAQQDKCDLIRAGQDNTQRIVDTLNNHWNQELQQKYNDARLELSQQAQNAYLISQLKTTTAAAA